MRKVLLVLSLPLLLVSCAGTDTQNSDDEVSTIPWNRPESWEGQGTLGGFTGTQ